MSVVLFCLFFEGVFYPVCWEIFWFACL